MKSLFFFFSAFFLFWEIGHPPALATSIVSFGNTEQTNLISNEQSLFQTFSKIQKEKQVLLETQIELRQANNRIPEKISNEVQDLSARLKAINAEIIHLEEEGEEEKKGEKEEDREATRFLLEAKSQELHQELELQTAQKKKLQKSILESEQEIEKLTEILKSQALSLAIRFGIFVGFVILLLFLRFITKQGIKRLSRHIPVARERALVRINTITFNIIIGISCIVVLFSQLISLLPILAVVGTAIAFALRDIISSFIAWFVIGTDQGYKIGDLIEAGPSDILRFRGRVIEVRPLLTVLRQTGMRGDTGQIVTFPNKAIFGTHIRNFSKIYRFTYIMIDFLIEKETNTNQARTDLLAAIQDETEKDIVEARKNLPNLQSKFGITEEGIVPQIFIEPDSKGILLRGKYLCRLENRHVSRTNITMNFLERISHHPDVHLRFVQLGDTDEF